MSLTFFKNKKPDTRMIEYDQAVIRLGLEKAALENEIESKRRDLKNLNVSYDLVRTVFVSNFEKLNEEKKKEIQGKAKVLLDFDTQAAESKNLVDLLLVKQKAIKDEIAGEEEKLIILSSSLSGTENRKKSVEVEIQKLSEERERKSNEATDAREQFIRAKDDLNIMNEKLHAVGKEKISLESTAEKARKELEELNEIISILQATNRQGLDVVASFEGERKRLQEKEDFLKRKEADLAIYEKRVEKKAKEVGLDIKMKFK